MNHEHDEQFLMVGAVARRLERSVEAVRGYERTGRLPAIRTAGGVRLFRSTDVERFAAELAQRRRSSGPPASTRPVLTAPAADSGRKMTSRTPPVSR